MVFLLCIHFEEEILKGNETPTYKIYYTYMSIHILNRDNESYPPQTKYLNTPKTYKLTRLLYKWYS